MKRLPALAAAIFTLNAGGALGQDTPPASMTYNLIDIEGLVVGTTLNIDAAYGEQHGVTIKTPFSFLVPTGDGLALFAEYATAENSTYIKITFATEDKQFVENIQFVPISVGMGERESRMASLAKLLVEQAYPVVVASFPQNNFISWRETKAGEHDVVEVLGEYQDPQWGPMFARVVGYLNPAGPDTIMAITNISARAVPIEDASQFPRTRSGVAIDRVTFLE